MNINKMGRTNSKQMPMTEGEFSKMPGICPANIGAIASKRKMRRIVSRRRSGSNRTAFLKRKVKGLIIFRPDLNWIPS